MVVGSIPEGSDTVDLTHEEGYCLGEVVVPAVGTGMRAV